MPVIQTDRFNIKIINWRSETFFLKKSTEVLNAGSS